MALKLHLHKIRPSLETSNVGQIEIRVIELVKILIKLGN